MCSISGGFNISREIIEKMNTHQQSRGPDHSGIIECGKVIFGHGLLAIADRTESAYQPIDDGGIILTYNGEEYAHDKRYPNDTKALHMALWGWSETDEDLEHLLNSMNGMYCFAFHDKLKDTITVVKDRFGIKPVYIYHQKDVFAFASTPAALSLIKPNWDISTKGIQQYLALGATTTHSLFEGIIAVAPGHYVTFNCKTHEVKTKRYYYPRFIENGLATIEERIEAAIDRVKTTCDFPQIILLSGGIDSTLVASRYQGQKAIHLRSPEQEYAEQVAKKFNIDLSIVDSEIESGETCLRDYITKSGDPTMAGIIPYITCQQIKKLGYRVAITANGADELFYGYDRMKNAAEQRAAIFREFSFTEDVIYGVTDWTNPQMNEILTYLTHDLNKTLDFASMCHSVEVRVPYLDHELVEAALSIPIETHTGQYGNKTILKSMLNRLGFDWSFIHRPKIGFSLHHSPPDWNSLQDKAMAWYRESGYEQPIKPTGRQEAYHRTTVAGLYIWMKVFKGVS